ncbi:23S rRNA pseudouridine(2604) synthase RluF [Vibrio cionasavignyae]|uniref:23S rRNA pseudouridine(2604) synthase RluF n=1 Tax=Vibrio cionasavignyae TaxID=2910252 RepID=UPI003D0A8F4A
MPNSADGKRLNKYISETGFCSRREADRLIEQKRVTINGIIPEMGTKVLAGDNVEIDGKPVKSKEKPVYIALNKPTGITCTTERDVPGNIVDFIGHSKRIFPIGRLDKPSDGLIFLTNDGDIVNKILRAGNNHEKEYVVRVDKPISKEFLKNMGSGVAILDTVTLPCKVEQETKFSFRITLTQGLNRQIRRMCEALGYEVLKLRRVRIMNISIDGIPNGKWRYLSEAEVQEIHALCEDSSSTEEASRKDGSGRRINKATDAKLHDARIEAKREKMKTFSGHGADEFRRGPKQSDRNSQDARGHQSGRGKQGEYNKQGDRNKPNHRNHSNVTRTHTDSKQRSNDTSSKPRARVSGTLSLKK